MIELTEAQQKEAIQKKIEQFRAGFKKLEEETGMTLIAVLQPSPTKIEALLATVPLQK